MIYTLLDLSSSKSIHIILLYNYSSGQAPTHPARPSPTPTLTLSPTLTTAQPRAVLAKIEDVRLVTTTIVNIL